MTAGALAAAVRSGDLSAREVALAAVERVDRVRAFTERWPRHALALAADVDRRVRAGERLPLAGVPLAVKATERRGSEQTRRLVAAGCVPVGATATPGPGTAWQTWGATADGPTLNPLHAGWSPGGSSAGSAAAVATGLVPLATGSDGAGSVRIPAAWCEVVGLKTTRGLLPARDRAGLTAYGPLARTAADAALYLDALTGNASHPTSPVSAPPPRVAWSATLGFAGTLDRIAAVARSALNRLGTAGAVVPHPVPVRLPDPAACWAALRSGEAQLTGAVARRHAALRQELDRLFRVVDLLATPTTPYPPHGHEGPGDALNTALTWAFNISGHPAVSLPAGRTAAGEPVGLQLVARHHRERDLLAVAAAWETAARG